MSSISTRSFVAIVCRQLLSNGKGVNQSQAMKMAWAIAKNQDVLANKLRTELATGVAVFTFLKSNKTVRVVKAATTKTSTLQALGKEPKNASIEAKNTISFLEIEGTEANWKCCCIGTIISVC